MRRDTADGVSEPDELSEASDDAYSTPEEGDEEVGRRDSNGQLDTPRSQSFGRILQAQEAGRRWPRDVFWLLLWLAHLAVVAYVSVRFGRQRWHKQTRNQTEDFWPMYAMGAAASCVLAWIWLWLLRWQSDQMIKVALNGVCTYLAVISVFCFWDEEYFWAVAFAIGALLQFLYAVAVMDRLGFTKLMVRKAVGMVEKISGILWVVYGFVLVFLLWLAVWTFGISGVVAFRQNQPSQWWIILLFSISLFWTGAVFCNTVHSTVAGSIAMHLTSGLEGAQPLPKYPTLQALYYILTVSLGSICYGSLFTAAIRTLRWTIRGLRARCGRNECMLCCVDALFNLVETLVRFFNKYGFVEVAIHGKGFNHASRDVWELFQSTGMEALIAYDLTGAVLIMVMVLGALMIGTAVGCWCWFVKSEYVVMVGATSMLMGAMTIGITMVSISSTVTAIYVMYADDPTLIGRVDADFAAQMAEALHIRLQHRSGRSLGSGTQNRTRTMPLPVLLPPQPQIVAS